MLALAALARAEVSQNGNLQIAVSGKLVPHRLPRTGTAPVAVSVAGEISTTDASTPPQLKLLRIEINRHGYLEYQGLPVCDIGKIQPASNGRALAACGSSLVGQGKFFGDITLPGSDPYPIEGRLLVFNGKKHGRPVLFGHIFSAHPFATSFVIPFAISKQHQGDYGTTLTANVGKALGGKRSLTRIEMTLSRHYSYRGARRSYVNAGCPAPKGVHQVGFPLARTTFSFVNGSTIAATLDRSCSVRG
jgi:hypothetical protein